MHRGSLLLINYNNKFEYPTYPDYIFISKLKTSSYRIADSEMQLSYSIMEPLNEMMDAFYDETGLNTVTITSAYRTFEKQQAILDDYIAQVGRKEALKWASLPGYSEHHSGLAFDLGIYTGGKVRKFSGDGKYAWFKENSYKYGFILRYPPNKSEITKITSEPWHFRYVGAVHAYLIHEHGWCFEEYIDFITEYTQGNAYKVEMESGTYEIFFTQETETEIPEGCEYTISGNNIDGYIVTVKR